MNLTHIAFILDGNRRWAKQQGKMAALGHEAGANNVREIAIECQKKGIKFATFWALSTENLKERSSIELAWLFELITRIPEYFADLVDRGIRIRVIGNIESLPEKCQKTLREIMEKTKDFTSLVVTLAINYGGRDEILRAVNKLLDTHSSEDPSLLFKGGAEGGGFRGDPSEIRTRREVTEEEFAQHLDTNYLPDPDMIVRTGGKKRLSGYLPWQSVYSELYFTDVLWPDFDNAELENAITYFHQVQRNFGQ